MSYNEANKLELLNSLKAQAFLNNSVNTSITEYISFELKTIPDEEKHKFHDFVELFLELGFESGYESNINLEEFSVLTDDEKNEIIIEELENDAKETNKSITSFEDLFEKVKVELKDYFVNYKGYFITELINSRDLGYKLIFFYENNYHVTPLKGRVGNQFNGYECDFIEFNTSVELNLDSDKNYLCIFLLMSKMNNKDGLKNIMTSIKKFINNFQDFYYHSITEKKENLLCENTNRRDDFIDEIDVVLSTYISNGRINFEEEKIIKKLCADFKSPLIFYKILSGGFSGSKVLEIRPKKTNNFENDKIYIIKYGFISDGKIKEEKDNFSEFIKGRKGFLSYTDATYEKTLHYEGILYNYAISENSKVSYSFDEILKKAETPYCDIESKKNIITNLFSENEAFNKWREDFNELKTGKVGDLYIDFVSKDKIENTLKYILNDENKSNAILDVFDKISNYTITYKETVCHGDLHTDNFFVDDEKNIYLIDFGFTNKRHSILDYTSLECSLKFKHFPFYLESNELIEIEKELLSERTFDLSYNFVSTKRKEVIEFLSMINTIRHNSLRDFSGQTSDNIEYYISLYFMTIRQIRYPNMNQLYAYHSTKKLGEFIVEKLKL
ncbi:phosphotransferase [Flavobacterium sp. Fl-77]|uniref:Phosphotransferase n=1 Tax=Flavobacterium flavipigmentatum TaxID=2893884 RepID=A0AAJ2VY41_9FLAO|nr:MULTISPECIES: phosphotransferase [unclassified Flavobacterium]MDX6183989.1 phosphotransferase [Flavobacterium sp. Fl-33]MDX6187542.1 phosphotransferase [Flavobacterium sp. Fl-77]UFH38435.1 phosphotransferase [Flavobacterium sp. F-70]